MSFEPTVERNASKIVYLYLQYAKKNVLSTRANKRRPVLKQLKAVKKWMDVSCVDALDWKRRKHNINEQNCIYFDKYLN